MTPIERKNMLMKKKKLEKWLSDKRGTYTKAFVKSLIFQRPGQVVTKYGAVRQWYWHKSLFDDS